METETLKFIILLFVIASISLYTERKIVVKELEETENNADIRKGRLIWTILFIIGLTGIIAMRILFRSVETVRLLFLFYVFLYSSLIGLVDAFSHNYYLEMLPGLILFIPIGCFTWGFSEAICGLLAGFCVGLIMSLTEYLFFRKLTYGSGDTVYGAAASALIGFGFSMSYWMIFCLILLISAAVHIFYVRTILKQNLEENRFIPLLPWFALATTGFYAFLIINY